MMESEPETPATHPEPTLENQGRQGRGAGDEEVLRARGPTSAKAHFIEDDVLVVVMREPATTAERAMAPAAGREEEAARLPARVPERLRGRVAGGSIEAATGRKVATYHSQILFDPDMLFEIFVFESSSS